jgi:hypothetical protein
MVRAAARRCQVDDYLRVIYSDTICFEPSYMRSVVDSGVVDPEHLDSLSTAFPTTEPQWLSKS